jgi:hypothetical protein
MRALSVFAFAALVSACSSSEEPAKTGNDGTTSPTGATKDSGAPESDASKPADNTPAPTGPCTEANSLCLTFKVPELSGQPVKIFVGFFKSLPPAGPPDVMGGQRDNPTMTSGGTFEMKMTDIEASGEYYVYASLHMPGGGQFQPKKGVDFVAFTPQAVNFDGTAKTLPELTFLPAQ